MTSKRSPAETFLLVSISVLFLIGLVVESDTGIDKLSSFHIFEVPYSSQSNVYWCGPASLVMVLGYWGVNVTQEDVAAEIYDPEARLTDISAMKSFARNQGFRTEELNGTIDCLREWISRGCPAIVLQKISPQNPYGHYRVVLGYDDEKEIMTTFDPTFGTNYNITYAEFAELWKPGTTFQTCNWTLLVIPKNGFLICQAEKRQLFLNQKPQSTQQRPLKPEEGYLIAVSLILALLTAPAIAQAKSSRNKKIAEPPRDNKIPKSPSRQEDRNQTEFPRLAPMIF